MGIFDSFNKKRPEEKSGEVRRQIPPRIEKAARGKWQIGDKILDHYEIRDIKWGGMGIVYIALDRRWDQFFAVKTFQDEYFWDENVRNRFMREAETWVNLERHTNIVFANFFGGTEGKTLIFLEYIGGGDLSQFIGRLDIPQALDFAIQLCVGMEYAYDKLKIVHRDIKPSNVMVTKDGRFRFGYCLKVSDFGLVKAADITKDFISRSEAKEIIGKAYLTQFGASFGTPEYMPPEQFLDARKVDMRGDIYSAMVMCYQMFAGKLPFQVSYATRRERFERYKEKHLNEKPINTRSINPKIPETLDRLIMKCLKKKPENRYQSFTELKNELINIYRDYTKEDYVVIGGKEPLTARDWIHRGNALINLRRYEEAIRCFDETLDIDSGYADAWSSKGIGFAHLGKYEEAIRCFDKALDIDSQFAPAWNNKGYTFGDLGKKYEEAIRCYDKALIIDSGYADAWVNKGNTLGDLGKYEEAIRCYDKALDIKPQFAQAWNNRGWALEHLKKYEEAIRCYDKALDIEPRYAMAWNNKGNLLVTLWRYKEAIECLRMFIKVAPPESAAYVEEVKENIRYLNQRI